MTPSLRACLSAALLVASLTACANNPSDVRASGDANAPVVLVDEAGYAVHGYDLVNYHLNHSAARGVSRYSVDHDGARFLFANAANQSAFRAEPERYLPDFGGYCAFGVAQGAKAPTDPKSFRLQDGRLLLFFNDLYEGKMMDTSKMWDENPRALLAQANANWPKVARQ